MCASGRVEKSFLGALRRGRGGTLVLALFLMMGLLAGCVKSETDPDQSQSGDPADPSAESPTAAEPGIPSGPGDPLALQPLPELSGLSVLEPAKRFFTLIANPIEMKQSRMENPGVLMMDTFQIQGLKNEAVQAAINADLQNLYGALEKADLPPYRGIYQRVSPGSLPASMTLFASSNFNFENLLSVTVYADKTYNFSDRSEYIGRLETRNYDLRTGRQVSLPELFADPEEAMALINLEVSKLLRGQTADEENHLEFGFFWVPRLTQPFKGLEANQKFYLQPSGLVLVLDHQTPQFDVGLYPAQLTLPFHLFEGKLAIRERFLLSDDSNLYLSGAPRTQQFIQTDSFYNLAFTAGEENVYNPKVRTYLRYRYPDSLPDPVMAIAKAAVSESRRFLKSLVPAAELVDGIEPYCEASLNLNQVGPYYTLNHSIYANGLPEAILKGPRPVFPNYGRSSGGQTYSLVQMPFYTATYDAMGRRITLEQCFREGVDVLSLVSGVYNRQAPQYGYKSVEREAFKDVMFAIGQTGLDCYVPVLGDAGYMNLPYVELGLENLRIFDALIE